MGAFTRRRNGSGLSIAVLILLAALGCGSDSEGGDTNADAAASAPSGEFESAAACLMRHQFEPCGAFPEEVVRGALPELGTSAIEQKSYTRKPRERKDGRPRVVRMNLSNCGYQWPSDMKTTIKIPGGGTMSVDREAEVTLSGIIEYAENPGAEFERTHRAPTPEQMADLRARTEKKLEEARAEGKIPESGKDVGKGLLEAVASGLAYREVPGLGTTALWESKHEQLSVLVERVKFDVSAHIDEDPEKNAQAAEAIAAALLEACS